MIDHFACWTDLPWAVIDVETTGFHPSYAKIVELAVVRMQSGKVIAQWSSLINPQIFIPHEVSRIHKIDNYHVIDSPRYIDALSRFVPLLSNAIPVAFNAPFDRGFLMSELNKLRIESLPCPALDPAWPAWVDPCTWVRSLDRFVEPGQNGKVSNALAAACPRWGVPFVENHRALADATATGQLLLAMAPEIGRMTVSELLRKQALLPKRKKT
jgi:DNA polymerase III epsilon subunit family exonuclease